MVTILKSDNHHHAPSSSPLCAGRQHLCILNIDGPVQPKDAMPAALLVQGVTPGSVRIVPVDDEGHPARNTAMGRCYVIGDDRFDAAARALAGAEWIGAVPVHDYPSH
jgi:hypothetical protein